MKRYWWSAFIAIAFVAMVSCQNSEEKAVREFGIHFGEMVQNGDKQGIKDVYSGVVDYDESHLTFYRDKVDIFPEGDGKYKVRYGDGAYIIVRTGLNGAMEVVESGGIFTKAEAKKETKKAEKPAKKEKVTPAPRISYSAFNDGYNVLYGSFNYKGAEYPFTVNFNYDSYSGKVTSAYYEATNTGGRNKVNSMKISSDERNITISGPGLSITASGSPGSYSGYMTRGKHSGSIIMNL